MGMRHIAIPFGVLLACVSQAMSANEATVQEPLSDLAFNLNGAASTRPATYDWRSISHAGATVQSTEYGSMVTSTKLGDDSLVLEDKLVAAPADQPANAKMVFDRTIAFAGHDLWVPKKISIDLSAGGKTVRIFNFENGAASYVAENGDSGTEQLDFSDGILTFNALLRLAPLIPRVAGNVYTFKRSDEPFLFAIHTADKNDPIFTIRGVGFETIKIKDKSHDCFKFELEQKSVPNRMDLWVDTTRNVVVKFMMPLQVPDDYDLEATLTD
jgi:hypothetical protein